VDFVSSPYSAIFDAPLTNVLDGKPGDDLRLVRQRKRLACRMLDLAR